MAKGIVKKKQYNDSINQLNVNIKAYYAAMASLKSHVDQMMKGDGDIPYWNGESAKKFYEHARKNMAAEIAAYNAIYSVSKQFALLSQVNL